ncbi:MAG TPA: hypothetical protein PK156_46360 [Polyangium sp.]|nr:hypothetical protein [Polyangium sp.]
MNAGSVLRSAWLEAMGRWHCYSVEGLVLVLTRGAKLLVAYHGRGIRLYFSLMAEEVRADSCYLPSINFHEGL